MERKFAVAAVFSLAHRALYTANHTRRLVVYRGPSAYDGAPIRAVLVLRSRNVKTGDMAQLFIMRDDVAPQVAQRMKLDISVCGMCPFRPALDGGCYVVTHQGPLATWKVTRSMPVATDAEVRAAIFGRAVRLGAYGDAAALPSRVVSLLVSGAAGRVTGYTHGHLMLGLARVAHLRSACMLSVESETTARAAHAAGWRTFRGRAAGAPLMAREIDCPSERGVECADCLLCCGSSKLAANISIPVHGSAGTLKRALRVVA